MFKAGIRANMKASTCVTSNMKGVLYCGKDAVVPLWITNIPMSTRRDRSDAGPRKRFGDPE